MLRRNLDTAEWYHHAPFMNSLSRYADTVYCIMRLVVGLLFACHGGQKLLSFPPGGSGGAVEGMALVAASIELVGGFLIAFGFLTRIAAFIASGLMACAYFMVHHKMGPFPLVNKGELAVMYCWVFFFMFFYGPGRLSIDALIGKGKAAATTTP